MAEGPSRQRSAGSFRFGFNLRYDSCHKQTRNFDLRSRQPHLTRR